jgi:hypothetical protein
VILRTFPTARSSLIAIVTACAVLVGGLAEADEARAARGMELALQDDSVFLGSNKRVSQERALRHARALGVTRLRVNLIWKFTMAPEQARARRKPRTIAYNFSGYDALIDAAARRGIRVHLSLTGPAPAWANARKSRTRSWFRPNVRAYGRWARVAAEHFRGRVDRYSIWNEPNWKTWLGPLNRAASIYRSLYIRGYGAVKKADRRAQVLIGETSPTGRRGMSTSPLAFLRRVACVNSRYRRTRRCTRLQADGYAHHPYDFRHAPSFQTPNKDNVTIGTLSRLTRALDRLSRVGALRRRGGGRMPLYLTEYGYFASGRRALPRQQRNRFLQQAYTLALRNGRVRSQLQYLLVSPPRKSRQAFFDLALLNQRGRPYSTYRALRRWYGANRRRVKRPRSSLRLPAARPNPID